MTLLKILKFRVPISLYSVFHLSQRKETLILTPKPCNNFIYKSSILWNYLRVKLGILDFSVKVNSIKAQLKSLILSNQNNGNSVES